jgi:6-pyruvoyl-tetrahydropterin synthase
MITQTQRYDVARAGGHGWRALEVTISGEPGAAGYGAVLLARERMDDIVDDVLTALIVGVFPELEEITDSAEPTTENVCRWVYTQIARAIRAERKRLGITLDMDIMIQSVRLYERDDVWVTVG